MNKEQLLRWGRANNLKIDQWDNMKTECGRIRFKIRQRVLRAERRVGGRWVLWKRGFLSKLSLSDDGKLKGLKRH